MNYDSLSNGEKHKSQFFKKSLKNKCDNDGKNYYYEEKSNEYSNFSNNKD